MIYIYLAVLAIGLSSCSFGQRESENCIPITEENELKYTLLYVDSLLLDLSKQNDINKAYSDFLCNYEDYCEETSIASEVHDLLLVLQHQSIFFCIWEFSWLMDFESYDRVLWLSISTSGGEYWKDLEEKSKEFSPVFFDSYTATVQKEGRIGLDILKERCLDISYESDFDRTLLAVLIITSIINSY